MKPSFRSSSRLLAALAAFYLVFAMFYMIVIRLSWPDGYEPLSSQNFWDYYNWRIVYLDYPLKALFTLPVWYLTFRTLAQWRIGHRVALNLLLLPVWVKGWQLTYYWLTDRFFEGGHLKGGGEWWDIYIPALFYVLQFGIFHAYHYYQHLRSAENARAEAQRLALTSELSALKAQLNPHFLYNAFNTISASVPSGAERTRQLIAQLSDLFRYQLRANRTDRVPLAQELAFVSDYLELEKARFGDRLHYDVQLEDPALESALIPPLLLQPLVENAVRHGIAPLVAGGTVLIKVTRRETELTLTVTDNGLGFDPTTVTRGYGLTNTERRLRLLFAKPLLLRSAPQQGTECSFTIPLTHASESAPDRRRSPRPQTPAGIPG